MRAPSPQPGGRVAALFVLVICACGGQEPSSEKNPAAPQGTAVQTPQRPPAPARLFHTRLPAYGPWWDELLQRLDPGATDDPWTTEVVASLARGVLTRGFEHAIAGAGVGLAPVLGPRATALSGLRPAETRVVRGDGVWTIRRGIPVPLPTGSATGPEALNAIVSALVAPYRGCSLPRVQVWITGSVQQEQPQLYATRCHLRLSGQTGPDGLGRLQTNLILEVIWRLGPKRMVLASLRTLAFEEARTTRVTFDELTTHVLGAATSPDGWLWQGALEQVASTDNLVLFTDVYLGMHGMALGDVDGDGLEDVYVARQGGLPNLLLKHLPGGRVLDVAHAAGVDFLDDTSGVLVVDLDGDGARDLALGVGADVVLVFNDGQGRFTEIRRLQRASKEKVYTLAAADADGDGDLDLYDTRYFTGGYGGGEPTPYYDAQNGAANSFWRNEGERNFIDATAEVGLDQNNQRFSLSAMWEDIDDDGDQDLYVVNDFGRNSLYRNDGGHFTDVAAELGLVDRAAGMGVSSRDVDGDGDLDLYVSNMHTAAGRRVTAHPKFQPGAPLDVKRGYLRHTRGNTLLLNQGGGVFRDATAAGMVGPGGWSWGSMFADFDNDGLPDLHVPNGFLTGRDKRDLESFFWRCVVNASPAAPPTTEAYHNGWSMITRLSQTMGYSWNGNERNYAYLNLGQGVFADVSSAAGLDVQDDTRVACVVDWDGDGRLDTWFKNRTAPLVRFLRNAHPAPGNWIAFELVGRAPNTDAIGARVRIETRDRNHVRTVHAGEGFLGGSSRRLHFGLGAVTAVERVSVRWPDGSRSEYEDLQVGSLWRLDQRGAKPRRVAVPGPAALDTALDVRLPTTISAPAARTVALERFPYAGLPLPRFDGAPTAVSEYSGRCLLVYCWGSWDADAVAGLARLARAQTDCAAAGLDIFPLSLDGPRNAQRAAAAARASGLTEPGGRADRRVFTLVEFALQIVLSAYDDLPLPLGLLFDEHGRLCVVYVGDVDPDLAAQDAGRLLGSSAVDGGYTTTCLTGGRWIDRGPARALGAAAEFLRNARDERAIADELDAFDRDR